MIIENVIIQGKGKEKIGLAIERFREGNVTLREAASMAGLDYWDFQSELDKRGVPIMQGVSLARRRIERITRK